MDRLAEIVDSGCTIPGTELACCGEALRAAVQSADVLLAKGQGNFETLIRCGYNVYYIFLCKCERLSRLLNKPLMPSRLVPLQGDVRFFDVDFAYEEGKPVLHNISLFAKPGQKLAFVGATGAGKTTITNLINRFYDIADGKIRYDGVNINHIRKADLRHSLGIVLQDVNLFTGTVMEKMNFDFRRDAHTLYIAGLFLHLESHKDFIELLHRYQLLFLIKDEFDRAFLKREDGKTPKYACYMAAGAYYNLFYYWVLNGYRETPEELSKLEFAI